MQKNNTVMLWVDADACPTVVKELIFKTAIRLKQRVNFVANQAIQLPTFKLLAFIQVGKDFDAADDYIVNNVKPGDIVITADIPLAARLVENQAIAINPRGEIYSVDNIKSILSLRNFMHEMRSAGLVRGGAGAFNKLDIQKFANSLDSILTKARK